MIRCSSRRKIASQRAPVLMAIRPSPKLKSYRTGGNGMSTRCPMARIPVPMPRSETTRDQCGAGSFFIDFDRGQGFNVPVAQRPLTKGVTSALGHTGCYRRLNALCKKWAEAENNNDAAASAALFTEDAVFMSNTGPVYGRQAIERWYTDDFQEWHHSNHIQKSDPNSLRIIGTADNVASHGEWSLTIQGKTGNPIQLNGHYSAINTREGNDWKIRMLTWNITPTPTAPEAGRTQRISPGIAKPSH
jgi:uncharacterized protein (TIGR02246 family)